MLPPDGFGCAAALVMAGRRRKCVQDPIVRIGGCAGWALCFWAARSAATQARTHHASRESGPKRGWGSGNSRCHSGLSFLKRSTTGIVAL
ncbi:hypothetical protein [Azospirillum palustre]